MDFGQFIRELRLKRRWTKEDLCGDEAELSIRQLTRLELGYSKPTLSKIEFIASRLGIPTFQLMKYYSAPPQDYLELKYLTLRLATFGDEEKLTQMVHYVDEMATRFYEQLPEDERVIIWILRCRIRMCFGIEPIKQTQIFHDYFEQVKRRTCYSINDLLLIHVYFLACQVKRELFDKCFYQQVTNCLLKQDEQLKAEEWFILRDVLIASLTAAIEYGSDYRHEEVIALLHQLMELTQDYQKKAVVYLLEWKCALCFRKELAVAKEAYQQALFFAQVIPESSISQKLKDEWELDMYNYSGEKK
ncbi:helix-turn-helix domain-containing protein [Streptococcus sp. zg-86]|uniref:Helix-turn-helix domain-containing protein n=1 Tax=Streptococcus zhangguiae TaxID=2664091 RepID=A0A6I4RI99_9STRE|nr:MULTISPECIES: helix-turn-helix domain-containing protein [unclassified Streptococcus]MTB64234.1 helix-turn-helix domain-containing protein [Streptococcus sp. zg-86]MTB90440.1 helix-turn-helix domain-containing protein [Streptococcus sp. zg-36]MWV56221.1 hypothetical protein [Streptococcus sp. zg-70]QTH48157.1 helix-turn-helix domain-containing protein [Streptococcus sp. zg-86]